MQKLKLKDFLPALILALICGICVFLLAGTYSITKDTIAKQEEAGAQERKLTIFPEARSFETFQYWTISAQNSTAAGSVRMRSISLMIIPETFSDIFW